MYVYRSKYGNPIFTPTLPDVEPYWEFDELPPGEGLIQITEDGELYRLEVPETITQIAQESVTDTTSLFVDSLLN